MLDTHSSEWGWETWSSLFLWPRAEPTNQNSKYLEVERDIEGPKSLFRHSLSSAQLASFQRLGYLLLSLDLPRASRWKGDMKTPWKLRAEAAHAAELHATAQSHLVEEQIDIYRATQTQVMEGRLNSVCHIVLKAWKDWYSMERFPSTWLKVVTWEIDLLPVSFQASSGSSGIIGSRGR